MKAAVLHKRRDLRIEEVPLPRMGPEDVLVRVEAVGICGSDVRFYLEGRIGPYVVEKPLILGHECAGEVAEVGASVQDIAPGDEVAVEPGVPCRRCPYCKSGRYNLCPDVVFLATPPVDGAFAEYIASPADFVHKLPEGMTPEEGALIEPLAVGLQGARRGEIAPGERVAVMGMGPIGLTALQAAKAYGATDLIAVDLEDHRLALARQLGATLTINARRQDPVEEILATYGTDGIDVVIEAAGSVSTTLAGLRLVRRGGRIVWIGQPYEPVPIDALQVIFKEVDIRGVFRYANIYPQAIRLMQAGLVNVSALITHRLPLDRAEEALNIAHTRADGAIKVLVIPGSSMKGADTLTMNSS